MRSGGVASGVACVGLLLTVACNESQRTLTGPTPGPMPGLPQTVNLIAVGDIGECGSQAVEQTARLVDRIDGHLVLAGDLAYMQGSMRNFLECFDPSWGVHRGRWRPTPGNHEYMTPFASAYFSYFGEAAGEGFYSFRAGNWLVLMLNSNIEVGVGSPQYAFAQSEILAHPTRCAMAVWHHPLFSSGQNGNNLVMRDLFDLLQRQGVDVVVAAHDHLYERFGKQDANGRSDGGGVRQFIVGTGGARLYDFHRMAPNSQVRIRAHGVLRFTLNPTNYDWAFLSTTGATEDFGSDTCH